MKLKVTNFLVLFWGFFVSFCFVLGESEREGNRPQESQEEQRERERMHQAGSWPSAEPDQSHNQKSDTQPLKQQRHLFKSWFFENILNMQTLS